MKYEVVNKKDGSRMSHPGEPGPMGTTLFSSEVKATKWMMDNGLSLTHEVREAK